jgi:hypothetical protein
MHFSLNATAWRTFIRPAATIWRREESAFFATTVR